MSTVILFLILGLGSGAVYAALSLGLVVTYRSSGVVNLASAAIALYIAYTYAYLRMGELVDPIPGLSPTVSLGGGPLGFWPAFLISLAVAAVLGALLYALIFRPLRAAPAAAKAVASVGVMIVLQALLATQLGSSAVTVAPIFPAHTYQMLGSRVPGDRLWSAAIIIALSIALGLWFRLSRFGLATRAAAESEKGAFVTGLSPQRIALVNWALSTVIAGVGGVLVAPIVPLTPDSYSLFIVAALAAALVGNFTRIGVTVAAAVVIGMLQSEATYLQTKSWLPSSGLTDLVPLLVILIFLVLRGQELPSRGAIIQKTLGRAPRPRGYVVPGALIVVLGLGSLAVTHGSMRAAVITTLVMAVIALSQVVVTGFTGQISFAQLTLAGVGAFSLTRIQQQLHVPFPFAPLLAAVVAMVIGVIVGLPALRIRGLPVAVTTLALAAALQDLWFDNPDYNGGFAGAPVSDAKIFGLDLGVGAGHSYPHLSFGILCLIVLLLAAGGVALVRRSRLGAAMLAVRANERSAAASGVSVAQVKLIAFAIGGFLAGLGGAMLAYQQTSADYSSYTAVGSVTFFATVYIAGITSVSGGINAGVIAAGGIAYTLVNNGVPLWIYVLLVGLLLVGIVQLVRPTLARAALAVVGLGIGRGGHRPPRRHPAGRLLRGHQRRPAHPHRHPQPRGDRRTGAHSARGLAPEAARAPLPRVGRPAGRRLARPLGRAPGRGTRQAVAGAAVATAEPPARPLVPQASDRPLLTVSGVGVRYGGVIANEDVSFEVFPGEILGLIGPNGAGKTTLIDAITGYARATGSVELLGAKLDARKPFQRSRDGLGRTFQGIELYDDLSVRENVEVGTTAARFSRVAPRGRGSAVGRHRRLLQDPGSAGRRRPAGAAAVGRPAPARLHRPRAGRAPDDRLA